MHETCLFTVQSHLHLEMQMRLAVSTRHFVQIKGEEVRRDIPSSAVSTVPGSRKFHHVRSLAPGIIASRELACFCAKCILGNYTECLQASHVDCWKVSKMNCSISFDLPQSDEEEELQTDGSFFGSDSDSSLDGEMMAVDDSADDLVASHVDDCADDLDDARVDGSADDLDDACVDDSADGMKASRVDDSMTDNSCLDNSVFNNAFLSDDLRLSFFEEQQTILSSCLSFIDFQQKAQQMKLLFSQYPLPEVLQGPVHHCPTDLPSEKLLKGDVKTRCRPLSFGSDGNFLSFHQFAFVWIRTLSCGTACPCRCINGN